MSAIDYVAECPACQVSVSGRDVRKVFGSPLRWGAEANELHCPACDSEIDLKAFVPTEVNVRMGSLAHMLQVESAGEYKDSKLR